MTIFFKGNDGNILTYFMYNKFKSYTKHVQTKRHIFKTGKRIFKSMLKCLLLFLNCSVLFYSELCSWALFIKLRKRICRIFFFFLFSFLYPINYCKSINMRRLTEEQEYFCTAFLFFFFFIMKSYFKRLCGDIKVCAMRFWREKFFLKCEGLCQFVK